MKSYFIIVALFILSVLIACTNDHQQPAKQSVQQKGVTKKEEVKAVHFAKRYVKTLYEIQYKKVPNTLKAKNTYYDHTYQPMMTDKAFQNMMQNREFDALRNGPLHEQLNVSVQTITIQIYNKNADQKSIEMKYHTKLIYQDAADDTKYKIPIKGQLTVTRNKENWNISRNWSDWKSAIPIKLLANNTKS